MAEKTKWELINERKRRKKEEAAIRAGGGLDRSWMRYTYCRICGKKICVNNYPDRKPRINRFKVEGIIMCPWCKHHGGKFIAQMYNLTQLLINVDSDLQYPPRSVIRGEAEAVMVESPKWKRERALQAKLIRQAREEQRRHNV